MRAGRLFLGVWGLMAAGCGGSTEGGPTGDGTGGSSGALALHPPSNIDLSLCYTFPDASDQASLNACGACCTVGGFQSATFHDGHCVCGRPIDDTGNTLCAAQTATSDACESCCTAGSFSGYGWVGDPVNSCACSDRFDRMICPASRGDSDPSSACEVCCLNHGYIGSTYEGVPTGACICRFG